jgi:hypothetical protein
MSEKKKVTRKQWEDNVRKAKSLVNNYDRTRWIIVDLALEVCHYNMNVRGESNESLYTIAEFSKEICIEKKTLYDWIRTKKLVFDKLPKTIKDNIKKYNYQDILDVAAKVEIDTPKKEVYSLFQAQIGIDPVSKKFIKYQKTLVSILYNAKNPMLLKDIPAQNIHDCINLCQTIVNLLNKELELRNRFSEQDRINARRLGIKDELAERLNK